MELFTHERAVLEALRKQGYCPRLIYDIGASNGVWSDTIALTLPDAEYHLFEPLADAVPFYRKDLNERMRRRSNFHLHPVALSDHSGTAEVFVAQDGYGSSMLDRGDIPEVTGRVSVPLHRLDEYVANRGLPAPEVMKLDVQGAERLILDGGRKTMQHASVLFLETWLQRGYGPNTPLLTEMIEWLAQAGFVLTGLGEQFRDDRGRVYSVDAVFMSNGFLDSRPGLKLP